MWKTFCVSPKHVFMQVHLCICCIFIVEILRFILQKICWFLYHESKCLRKFYVITFKIDIRIFNHHLKVSLDCKTLYVITIVYKIKQTLFKSKIVQANRKQQNWVPIISHQWIFINCDNRCVNLFLFNTQNWDFFDNYKLTSYLIESNWKGNDGTMHLL